MESDFSPLESAISYKFLMFQKIPKRRALCCLFLFLVGVTRFELATSWSRTMRATNCATPRDLLYYYSTCYSLPITNGSASGASALVP